LFRVATTVAAALLVASPDTANAQPAAAALGKPLESPDLPAGTVSVKVVAGAPNKPVAGTDVTLLVDGAPRIARTGDDGRAMFKDLKAGSKIQAVVVDPDKKELKSEEFPLPGVGVKLMLTTAPWNPGAAGGAAPMAGGGQGMPNPRQMSGEPRPEQSDPAGTFTVRLTYDDFKDAPPVGVPVSLVGYHANDTIDIQTVNSDAEGRAQFKGLDRSGATSYFALALLPRDGKLERLISTPAVLDARTGVRLILSGEKRTSGAPVVDDLVRFEKQDNPPPAGKVRVVLEGGADVGTVVTLVEVGGRPFANAKATEGPPDPSAVQGAQDFQNKPDIPAHSVVLNVHGGVGRTDQPLEGVTIMIAPAATAANWQGQVDGTTGPDGKIAIAVDKALQGPFVGIVTINGKTMTTRPFDISAQGGVIEVEAHWPSEGKAQADFDLTPRPGQVFYAETRFRGQLYRSLPFQPVPERGTRLSIFVYPRVLFTFSLTSRIDDKYLAVNGRFEVANNAWAPYVGGPDGLLVPLPKKFSGGLVAEKDQGDVALVPGEGFRLIRPLPPGSKQFHGAFSLPVVDGAVDWNLDLPFGAFNSGMEILSVPGMTVQTPPGVDGRTVSVPQGKFFVLPQVSILPKQSMVMRIAGLPEPPTWKVWMPRIIGIIVVIILLAGIGAVLTRDRSKEDVRASRRQKLLDELVELDRAGGTGKAAKRREQILAELETLWDAA
jgi:hypothetical protein